VGFGNRDLASVVLLGAKALRLHSVLMAAIMPWPLLNGGDSFG